MAANTQLTPEEKAAKAAADAEAQRLANAQAAQDTEAARAAANSTTVDPGQADPVAAALAAEPKTATCAACKAVWPADRMGPGVTIPCTCGRLVEVQ